MLIRSEGVLLSISSDAAVEHYPGWGGYAATKAALDQLTLTFGVENPSLTAYAVDPGDMRTAMHQAAFPGEDISDRPLPEAVVPQILALLRQRPPGGRYRAADLATSTRHPGQRMTTLSVAPLTRVDGPPRRTATAPPEERGLARDEVRLLVVTDEGVTHARFRDLPSHLRPGDLVVVNNSATLAAELDGRRVLEGRPAPVVVHAATRLDDDTWVVEVRTAPDAARAILDLEPGERIQLADDVQLRLLAPHPRPTSSPTGHGNRLWRVSVTGPRTLDEHLARHGRPIAYGYLDRRYPLAAYQTVFASRPGSAEMPSAARPFTSQLVTRLICDGVGRRHGHPAHRRIVTGVRRGATGRVARRPRGHGPARDGDPGGGRPGCRRGHHGRPRPGVGSGTRRVGAPGARLDRPRGLTRRPATRGGRPGHRVARS